MDDRANAPQAIGQRVYALMTITALTPKTMARIIGTSEGNVVAWQEGYQRPPRRRVSRLARQAGVTLAWVYYGDEADLAPQIASLLRRALTHKSEDLSSGGSPIGLT